MSPQAHAPSGKYRISLFSLVQGVVVVLLSLLLVVSIGTSLTSSLCLSVYIDGIYIGSISSPAVMQNAINRLTLQDTLDRAAVGKIKATYAFATVEQGEDLLDEDDCFSLLSSHIDHTYTEAFSLRYGDRIVAYLASQDECDEILSRLRLVLANALSGREEDDIIELRDLYTVSSVICEKDAIKDVDSVYNMLSASLEEELSLLSPDDDASFPDSPETDGTSSDRIYAFLNDKAYVYEQYYTVDVLRNPTIGTLVSDELQSMLSKFEQSFMTVHTEIETELIPYQIIYIEVADQYVGYSKVQTPGENGLKEITYEVQSTAGKETSRAIKSSRVVSPAVDAVILIGTKEYPKPIPTGTYVWPLRTERIITSYFGWRPDPFTGEIRYHNGMDIYAPKRTPIYAMDGGEVIASGWDGTYGLCVVIDHGNGIHSLYAHMDSTSVEKGDLVYQGQQIGKVGDTGRATGYHLHLEVRVWGSRKDPLDYLPD